MTSFTDLFTLHNIGIALTGAFGLLLGQQVFAWLNTNGVAMVNAKLEGFRSELNQSKIFGGLLGQINADDACIGIIEACIPDIIVTLSADVQVMLKNGTLTDATQWRAMAHALWAKAEGQIIGGAHDYLEHSSFEDGIVLAENLLRRFFAKQQIVNLGVVAVPPVAPVVTVTTPATPETSVASATPAVSVSAPANG
ncbi:MAG: hypothetical protein GZ088_09740 [Acidipila sp.]|nr:hypothetical protein [Acidipila sp.]